MQCHGHLQGGGFALPAVQPIFEEAADKAGLNGRLKFHPGDFFQDPLPSADVLVMGHILHDWNLEHRADSITPAPIAPAGCAKPASVKPASIISPVRNRW